MSRASEVVSFVLGGSLVLLLVTVAALIALGLSGTSLSFALGERVGLIEIEGVILDSRPVLEALDLFRDDDSVCALVLRVDSPGGGVTPSQEIHRAVLRWREETGRPVVVSMGSVAASGGYYVASAADEIVANRGSVTGSIGVIMSWTNYSDLLEWARLEPETIQSGRFKDVGDPARDQNPEQRALLQALVDELHEQFVGDVAQGRSGRLDLEELKTLADGRVFTGETALSLGLVDRIGDLQVALDRAAELADADPRPEVVRPPHREEGLLAWLLTSTFSGAGRLALPERGARFYYLW